MSGYINPYTNSPRWLRGNLHLHTCCGKRMPISVSGPIYANLGYDFVALTDHNRVPDAETLAALQAEAGLVLIPGEENGRMGDLIELGVHEVATSPDGSFADRVRALKQGGGFVIACHPQQFKDGPQRVRAHAHNLDAIEVYNSNRDAMGLNEMNNVKLWDEVLTAGERVMGLAVDDFHVQAASPGHGWVWVQAPDDSRPVQWPFLMEQLRKGAFYSATTHCAFFTNLTLIDGVLSVECGSFVKCIRVIGPGGRPLCEKRGPALEWQVEPWLTYFRVEAICRGIKRAWSQPFFAE